MKLNWHWQHTDLLNVIFYAHCIESQDKESHKVAHYYYYYYFRKVRCKRYFWNSSNVFIPLNKWLSLRGVRSLRSRDLIIGMQMCSAQNKNNNNNCAITSSQFEEDNFFIFEKYFSVVLSKWCGWSLHVFWKCASCVEFTSTYLMEAEKYTVARYASNPILQTIVVIHCFLFYDEKRTCVFYIHSTKLCYHWTITLCMKKRRRIS